MTEPLRFLAGHGFRVETLPVDGAGRIDAGFVDTLPSGALCVASVMLANNETGVIADTRPIAEKVRARGGFLHCDAVQAAGKIPVDFAASGAHLLSLSAHKIYGPKGIGALIAGRDVPLEPVLHGGGQERGLRGGTENVAAIVGFGKAAELALAELETRREHSLRLRRRLEAGLAELPGIVLFARDAERLPNTVQFGTERYAGETLVMHLDRRGFAVSSGSACASGGGEPSPVLLAMGIDPRLAAGAVRVSFGQDNTEAEVDAFLAALAGLLDAPLPSRHAGVP